MEMIGEPLNEQQLEQLLAIADLDQDGRINYEGKFATQPPQRGQRWRKPPLPSCSARLTVWRGTALEGLLLILGSKHP